MPTFTVITRDGSRSQVEGIIGASLMEALRAGGIDDIQALCGGCCSCATCHVFIHEGAEQLPGMADDEGGMLEGSLLRASGSRLSCQVPVTAALDGLVIEIAPEE
jgi:2Fe-2S ferredoxin